MAHQTPHEGAGAHLYTLATVLETRRADDRAAPMAHWRGISWEAVRGMASLRESTVPTL